MDAGSIERLFVKQGEKVGDGKVRQLEAAVARQGKMSGRGVRQRHLPWGTITSSSGGNGEGGTSPIFAPTISRRGDGFDVTWEKGLIAGVEPKIGEVAISKPDPDTGQRPVFHVGGGHFKDGEAKVYFRCTINAGWFVEKVEPFASGDVPEGKAWTADKLALIVFDDGSHWRALYSNQGHMAVNRRGSSGLAQHIFWGKM